MKRSTILTLLMTSFAVAQGCTAINLSSLWRDRQIVEDKHHPVSEVMCLWEPAEGTGLDGLPTRGFAGQILFFTSGQPSPAKVEGDVRIFVFDDEGVRGDKAQPIHQFDFPGAAWNAFMTTSNFGTAYQMFIPYTKPGGHHAECEIRVRYTPVGGNSVFSRPCTITLTGAPRSKVSGRGANDGSARGRSMIQQASYEVERGRPDIDPHTFQVPPSASNLAAASNGRARAVQVDRLGRLADALAEERGIQPVAGPPDIHALAEVDSSAPRRRLNPLAVETPATPTINDGANSATVAEERAKHILLSE